MGEQRSERLLTPEQRFQARIAASITSASGSLRSVDDPAKAAMYASNALIWHDPHLLAADVSGRSKAPDDDG